MKKYPKAKYQEVTCCPECGFNQGVDRDNDGMPNRNDFIRKEDEQGTEFIECPCGCRFVEEETKSIDFNNDKEVEDKLYDLLYTYEHKDLIDLSVSLMTPEGRVEFVKNWLEAEE